MLDIVAIIVLTVVLPVLINKTTEHHFDWVKPYVRQLWTGVLAFFSMYYLTNRTYAVEVAVRLHQRWHTIPWLGYLVAGLCGALLLCGYWWFTGEIFGKSQAATASTSGGGAASPTEALQQLPALTSNPSRAENKTTVPSVPPRRHTEEKPPTLTTLFKSDFSVLKLTRDNTITCPNGTVRAIKQQVYLDFDAKVDYVGFLILGSGNPTDSEDTFQIGKLLSDHVQDTLNLAKDHIATDLSFGRGTASTELAFSGRVFIYHEDFLSVEQRAELTNIYRSKNCSVEFRGPDYLAIKSIAWANEHDSNRGTREH